MIFRFIFEYFTFFSVLDILYPEFSSLLLNVRFIFFSSLIFVYYIYFGDYATLEFRVKCVNFNRKCCILVGVLIAFKLNVVSKKALYWTAVQWKPNYTVHYLTLKYDRSVINVLFIIKFRTLHCLKIWHRWFCGFA